MILGCYGGAQRGLKGSPKCSKIDQKEFQKLYLEKGTKKAPTIMIVMTPECGPSVVNSSQNRCSHFPKLVTFWTLFGTILAPFWTMLPHLGLQKGSSEKVSKFDPPKSCGPHAVIMQDSCKTRGGPTSKSPRCPLRCHNMTPT